MPKGLRNRIVEVGTIDFVASTKKGIELQLKPDLIQKIAIRLSGTLTLAGGTASGAVIEDSPLPLLNGIEVKASRGNNFKDLNPKLHYHVNSYENKIASGRTALTTGDAGAENFDVTLWIDFAMVWAEMASQDKFLLNTNNFDNLFLNIDFGAAADLLTAANDRTKTLSNMLVTVTAFTREPEIVGKSKVSEQGLPRPRNVEQIIEKTWTAATTKLDINLSENAIHKSFRIMATDDDVRSDSLVNSIQLRANSGALVPRDIRWNELGEENQRKYQIAAITGVRILETPFGKMLRDVLDTVQAQNPIMRFDVAAPSGSEGKIVMHEQTIENPQLPKAE